jgi:hypothetical protein
MLSPGEEECNGERGTRSPFVRGNSAAPKIVSQLAGVWRDDENPLYAFPIAQ